ncbi:receptor-like protein 32 [Punica granatum]|uniref:Receptor-like protein 32 n=1 Tax=Punica granatum TaxID=22663 RepID=A0A6P8EJ81_PUNGR|nr:receptor-like protein 32 [Punica granatum]
MATCSFPVLRYLYLSDIRLTKFPYFLSSSAELKGLDLSGNMISGGIPKWFWRVGRNTLTEVDFSDNDFNGPLPDPHSSIETFDASSNNFSGEIPSSICQASSLTQLDLSNNRLSGTIPRCLGDLKSLLWLDASNNSLTGEIPSLVCQMGNLSFLSSLDLSYNLLQGPLPQSLANCTSLQHLIVSYNAISDTFPGWLNAVYRLKTLHLQFNRFHGAIEIPLPPQISSLNLSNNEFSGQLPINFLLNSTAEFVVLANNNFEGPLPILSPSVNYYFVSNNEFSGDIPYQLCNATGLEIINLSNNCLTGTIPHCLINVSVSVLDLQGNQFVGQIPEIIFTEESWIRTIRLGQNQLRGTLPRSLTRCKDLEVLDLGENELEGHFPYWLDTLLICKFSGRLPAEYIVILIAMKFEEKGGLQYMGDSNYEDTVSLVMKGEELVLEKILTVFTTIDFSRNFFEGEIPEIPSSVENLTNLEWLDLSSNKLNGEIPKGLADLSSLSTLNLSYNQLVGPIPHGPQMDTFNHPFEGNPGLCGPPLSNPCDTLEQSPPHSTSPEEEEGHWIEWRAVAMGCGCGLIFGMSAGYLMLETGRLRWLVRMVQGKKRRKKTKYKIIRRSTRGQ